MAEALEKQSGRSSFERDQVVQIINSVISKVEGNDLISKEAIFSELRNLQKIIEDARQELGAARALDIKDKHIPVATDELDAVVHSTAEATGKIMDSCDLIMENATGENAQIIIDAVTNIYEACSFQDLTGQRIKKVISTIRTIEDKVDRLVDVLSKGVSAIDKTGGSNEETRTGDAALLNGPQMPDKAISQAEIDRLLSEFD